MMLYVHILIDEEAEIGQEGETIVYKHHGILLHISLLTHLLQVGSTFEFIKMYCNRKLMSL